MFRVGGWSSCLGMDMGATWMNSLEWLSPQCDRCWYNNNGHRRAVTVDTQVTFHCSNQYWPSNCVTYRYYLADRLDALTNWIDGAPSLPVFESWFSDLPENYQPASDLGCHPHSGDQPITCLDCRHWRLVLMRPLQARLGPIIDHHFFCAEGRMRSKDGASCSKGGDPGPRVWETWWDTGPHQLYF